MIFFEDSLSAITEFAKASPEKIKSVFLKDLKAQANWAALSEKFNGLELVEVAKNPGASKKDIVVQIDVPLVHWTDFSSTLEEDDAACLLVLDQISDPRNLGALIRSAAFFGCKGVIIAKDRQSPLTQAVVSTSCGGLAYLDVVQTVNIKHAMADLKKSGFWVYGTDASDGQPLETSNLAAKSVIVMGSEGKGMRASVRSQCDVLLSIRGAVRSVESLNVSTAAGILAHHWYVNQSNT